MNQQRARRFPGALACGSILFFAPATPGYAQGANPPVSIDSCAPLLRPNPAPTDARTFMGIPIDSFTSTSAGMRIVFVNDSDRVAKLVNFAIDSGGNQFVIRDAGTFSPGVQIDHSYRNGAGQGFFLPAFIAPGVTCRVASVEFADGSLWRHGAPPNVVAHVLVSPAPSGLSASPARVVLESASDSALFLVEAPSRLADLKETDNCSGIASVFVGATADRAATYYVRPLGAGSCAAHVIDEDGRTVSVPITVR